ncbi:MAG: heparinase II/III-family protein [Planctomycetota bacterium]|nr:heparinase II/III-family protein [Planctomycetota bacterium]
MSNPLRHYRFVPHTIEDRAYWNARRAEPRFAEFWKKIESAAAEAPPAPPLPPASDFLAATRHNDRGRLDQVWGRRATLSALAVNRLARGLDPREPDDPLLDWLWGYLTLPTWAVSAHLPGKDLPALGEYTLDLAACELAATLAEAREVLKPWMDAQSPRLADGVLHEIDRHVLTPYAEGAATWWDGRETGLNNWTGVCGGSILAACDSLAAQGHPRPQARERALKALRLFVAAAFTEHGECDEGIGYWNYGVGVACLGWSRLTREEFEAHMDLERLRAIADYPRRAHLFGETFYCANDGGLTCRADTSFVPWLACATGNAWLGGWARRAPAFSKGMLGQYLRVLEGPELPEHAADAPAATAWLADQQTAILRAPTERGELLVSLSGGDNAERHNHNDLGHFLAILGERVIVPDLGAPTYFSDFFGPNRYRYVAASSRGHNCPLIEDHEQRAGKEAAGKVLDWRPEAEIPRLALDLTAAYPPEAGLKRWTRSLERWPARAERREPARMVLTDVFLTEKPNAKIVLPIWTLEEIREHAQRPEGGGVTLELGPLYCELSPSPVAVGKSAFDPAEFHLRDWKGRTLRRVDAVYRTDARGELKVETRFFA